MSAKPTPEGQAISEVAHAEGGTTKGSASAQMQSEVAKQRNAEQGIGGQGQPTKPTPEGQAISEVAHQEGGTTKGSVSAQMQSELSKQRNAEQGIGGQGQPTKPTPEGQAISEVAHQEGGTTKGSASAQMQSELSKQRNAEQGIGRQGQSAAQKEENFEQVAAEIGRRMQTNPESITKEDASLLESREHRAMGVRPPTDSIAADAQRMASANEQGGTRASGTANDVSRGQQSNSDRAINFQNQAGHVASKMASSPENVTKEDADVLHSREQRAHGHTEKGGISSQAQSLASENKA